MQYDTTVFSEVYGAVFYFLARSQASFVWDQQEIAKRWSNDNNAATVVNSMTMTI